MPMPVQISGDRGLVWNVEDILKLRKEYRLVGCMVGGISRFQSQVAVMGLPLQLSPEEVSLAAAAGWIELCGLEFRIPTAAAAAKAAAAEAAAGAASAGAGQQQAPQQPRQQEPQQQDLQEQQQQYLQQQQQQQDLQQQHDPMLCDDDPAEFDEFYAAYYGLEAPKQQQQQVLAGSLQLSGPPGQQQQCQQQQRQQQEPQAWQLALKSNRFPVPMTIADTAAGLDGAVAAAVEQQAGEQQQQQQEEGASDGGGTVPPLSSPYCQLHPATWQHPTNPVQWLRLAVFADLHSRGFCVTGGAKFGGDFLAYPGDPHLYHAQYVVRVVAPDQVLVPSVLQGLARGVHAARKHLVLATVQAAAAGGAAAAAGGGGGGGRLESKGAAAAAAVGGLSVTQGVGVGGAGDRSLADNCGSNSSSQVTAAVAAVAAAATEAACQVLFGGGAGRTGPVQIGAAAAKAADRGVLRYITVARETGWGGD